MKDIRFHKVLQEVEKYRKLKTDIKINLKPRQIRLQKNNVKNYLNKVEKKAMKMFYGKLQILQVSRVQMPFKS